MSNLTGDIELKNLTFQYPDGDTPVLKNVSVHIKPGEMLAVLGRTGSGKSTLADLLLRVYDCEKGMLLMDGRPIDEIPLHVLHRDVAYVPQENFMFSDTLEENIAFGLEDRILIIQSFAIILRKQQRRPAFTAILLISQKAIRHLLESVV